MYRSDAKFGRDSSVVVKTKEFTLPKQKTRSGSYKIPSGTTVFTCMTSDFFIEEADVWRMDIWDMMRQRQDLFFCIVTKRLHRFEVALPLDWGEGYPNVCMYATCENQHYTDERLPILLSLPLFHKRIIHEPMLEAISIEKYLKSGCVEHVLCGGESGPNARLCKYAWILQTRAQCERCRVDFSFKQTGHFFEKDGIFYKIPRKIQGSQARKANIDLHFSKSLF